MDVSIIIPAWNESSKIAADMERVYRFLQNTSLQAELIIVDDGSSDGTAERARQVSVDPALHLNVLTYRPHRGKGFAVRTGMTASRGEYILFMDSGGNVPLSYISVGLERLRACRTDILMGSRHLPESKITRNLIWYRRITSFLFRQVVKLYFNLPAHFTDTQCGFKLFKGDIGRELFALCRSDGFLFDLEIILLARQRNYRIVEFPIEWQCDRDSRLSVFGTSLSVWKELRRLKQKFNR